MTPSPRSRSFSKIFKIKEEVEKLLTSGASIPFIAITETWLKDHVHDAQICINNFNVFRSDRKISKNGGVILYLHNRITVTKVSYYDDDFCGGVICLCQNVNFIIACVYRPPNSNKESFSNLLKFLTDFINSHNSLNKMQVIIFGDFNFPRICWDNPKFSPDSVLLDSFMDSFFFHQYIRQNTRHNNILDLLLTDNPKFVDLVKVECVDYSDHNLILIIILFWS